MSINTTVPVAMSSLDSLPNLYLSVIRHTFSSFGSIFASLALWIVHGLALALCFFSLVLAVSILFLPIKFTAERIFENISAEDPNDESPSSQCQQQDLEANTGSLEGVRTTSAEQVQENATKEQACLIPNKTWHAMDTSMASRAPKDSTDEQVPLANISDRGSSNAGDGEIVDMPSDSVDSELEEHAALSEGPGTIKPDPFWASER